MSCWLGCGELDGLRLADQVSVTLVMSRMLGETRREQFSTYLLCCVKPPGEMSCSFSGSDGFQNWESLARKAALAVPSR